MIRLSVCVLSLFAGFLAVLLPAQAASPVVVTTIRPLHSLAASVMGETGTPHLLIQGNASPHGYALRPSDAAVLEGADIVLWIGPTLESFLEKPLSAFSSDRKTLITAETLDGIKLYPSRPLLHGRQDEPAHTHEHDHGHDHDDHHHDGMDPHLWLDIGNARLIVEALRDALAARDPENANRYEANAAQTLERLNDLDHALADRLANVKDLSFISFHDAYQYFERAYGLHGIGSLSINPDRPASAGHLRTIRALIADEGVVCVFQEPQFPTRIAETAIEGTSARLGVLDPLGSGEAEGPDLYPALMHSLAETLHRCLKPE